MAYQPDVNEAAGDGAAETWSTSDEDYALSLGPASIGRGKHRDRGLGTVLRLIPFQPP